MFQARPASIGQALRAAEQMTMLKAALVYMSRAQRLDEQHAQAALIEHLDSHLPVKLKVTTPPRA